MTLLTEGRRRCTPRVAASHAAVAVLGLLLLAACGGGEDPTGAPGSTTGPRATTATRETDPDAAGETRVKAYFLRGETVAPVRRTVPETEALARAAVEQLFAGPTDTERGFGLASSIPEGTELHSIAIEDGLATVDVSRAFESGGGTLSMTTRLAQLVFTLTQFSTVDAVDLRLDGEDVEYIGGEGILVDPPRRRADFEEATPVLLVESPAIGDAVSSPLTVIGSAAVFEGTVLVTITDREGRIIAEETTTTDEGAPARGDFRLTVRIDVPSPQLGAVIAAAPDAAGGPPQHVFEVPVQLEPR